MNEPHEIKPALTAEEWADLSAADTDGFATVHLIEDGALYISRGDEAWIEGRHHAVAALALHGQPFGFTWEMVDAIEALARTVEKNGGATWVEIGRAAASRIAALLPSRDAVG
jgi:hypothetical protein